MTEQELLAETDVDATGTPSLLDSAPGEVKSFILFYDIADCVELATRTVTRLFPTGSTVSLRLETDPEIDDSWIDVRVTTTGETRKLLDVIKHYSAEWVSRVPGTKRYLVRLSLDVA